MNNEQPEIDPSWQELINAFANGLIEEPKKLIREYRFYYNEDGEITQLSDCNWNHPESGNYVVVDEETHRNYTKYRVRNGHAELKPTDPTSEVQLKQSTTGHEVAKSNPGILLEPGESLENTEHYDRKHR